MTVQRLPAAAVYQACDIKAFPFDTTSEIQPLDTLSEALGQPRAVDSLHFGTGMRRTGFNIFVLGPSGTGRHSMARKILDQKAKTLIEHGRGMALLLKEGLRLKAPVLTLYIGSALSKRAVAMAGRLARAAGGAMDAIDGDAETIRNLLNRIDNPVLLVQ